MNVNPLIFNCGGQNIPGTVYRMYMVSCCDIYSFPALKPFGDVGDSITLDGNIILKVGKIWSSVNIISDTGKITHTAEGSLSAKSFTNKLDFKLHKDAGSDEWFNKHINFRGVVIIREKVGAFRVFGSLENPARFESAEGTSGDDSSTEKSWIAQIVDKTGKVAPYYEGPLPIELTSSWSTAFSLAFS